MSLGTCHHQRLFCGCIYIEEAIDFYTSPSLYACLGRALIPGSDSRAVCTLETTENNRALPKAQRGQGGEAGPQAKYTKAGRDL